MTRPSPWARARVKAFFTWGPMVASALRKRWAVFKNPHASISFGRHVYAGPGFSVHAPFGGRFEAGDGCEFRRGFRVELGGPDTVVRFGRQCVCTYDVLLQVSTRFETGDRCTFGQCTSVYDGSHAYDDPDVPMLQQGYDFRSITIGDDVNVMGKTTVIASLGDRALVAAGAVVTRDVPPWHVVGGVPARTLRTYGPAADEAATR